ncbi:helix-turn-helix domain-containing protein [Sutterella sp.]|uniref:helix-turn-helix domain-containing protein n=1 Tax=Sutterella sp. TaxID=1981025 RepID=UPI0026E0CD81|nr:helix-turn-helix transcriptional regulator [Sutterella sp.]MDO5532816.1 helix-turn-helix transcriptional regulator [Sutterella sp.]
MSASDLFGSFLSKDASSILGGLAENLGSNVSAETLQAFAARLNELLQQRGISQESLAESLNVALPTVLEWLKGQSMPSALQLPQIAEKLGIDLKSLLGK